MESESHAQGLIETEFHDNGVYVIRLNRPKALNAVNIEMLYALNRLFQNSERNGQIRMVILEGNDRAFCAGGDVRGLCDAIDRKDWPFLDDAFHQIYALCYHIARFPKTIVSLMNGICMGGGVGLSIYTPYRVISKNSVIAMPEVGIGFFPDVSASYFLNQRGGLGYWMGLTGVSLSPQESLMTRMATHYVESISDLRSEILKMKRPSELPAILDKFYVPLDFSEFPLFHHRKEIEGIFSLTSWYDVMDALEHSPHEWVSQWKKVIESKSPTSIRLTFDMLQGSKVLSLKECFDQDENIVRFFHTQGDFVEGVRAFLWDKDHNPKWSPFGTFNQIQFPYLNKI
jgi:enoyl-CoA hydratase/carnithine racemase